MMMVHKRFSLLVLIVFLISFAPYDIYLLSDFEIQISSLTLKRVEAKDKVSKDKVDESVDNSIDDITNGIPGGKAIGKVIKKWTHTVMDTFSDKSHTSNKSKKSDKNKSSVKQKKYIEVDFQSLEEERSSMVNNLSKATAFTAASEYKLQEVTGITNIGHYTEKGSIANSLQSYPEMKKNYRFAELESFVNEIGANKIINILNQKHQQNDNQTKEKLTWAKNDRAKAKQYNDTVKKEAMALSKKAAKLMSKADSNSKNRLQNIKTEADDAVKLAKALDLRNKAVDNAVKNYEKSNKIVANTN